MIRINRGTGFVPASPWMPTPVLGSSEQRPLQQRRAKAPRQASRVMAQAVVMSPEQVALKAQFDEARMQLDSLQDNYTDLVTAMGEENAAQALAEAQASVDLYARQMMETGA